MLPIVLLANSSHAIIRSQCRGLFLPTEIEIILAIQEGVKKYLAQKQANGKSSKSKTDNIFKELESTGKSLGYDAKHAKNNTEWLWDIVWAKKRHSGWLPWGASSLKNDWGAFEGVFLAGECEWNGSPEEYLLDFAKLTVADVDLRLFIHSETTHDGVSTVDMCKALLRTTKNHRYLFVGYEDSNTNADRLYVELVIS